MSGERKLWSAQEDKILLDLKQQGIKKWSDISKIMQTQYNITGRSGKQCRQRWFNKLNPKIDSGEWSSEDTLKLFQLHNKFGNSWVKISQQQFKGRTDNNIKNHFYSVLRKSIRRINKYLLNMCLSGSKFSKKVDSNFVSKVVSASDDKFDKKLFLPISIIQRAHLIKNKLIPFSELHKNQWGSQQEILNFYNQIIKFQKDYQYFISVSQDPLLQTNNNIEIKEENQQQNSSIIITSPSKNIFIVHQQTFKQQNDIKQQAEQLSKLPSNSIFVGVSNYCKSSSGSSEMMFLKKVSNHSGLSCLFPRISSQQWQKDAMKLSLNNLQGQNGQLYQVSDFLLERLDNN